MMSDTFGESDPLAHLDGLTSLSAEAAEALAKFQPKVTAFGQCGHLHLNGLTSLSVEAAEALAEFRHAPAARVSRNSFISAI